MKLLEERILKDGKIINNEILKVDSFINHQIDVKLLNEICAYLASKFEGKKINKIITIETSGIAFAIGMAQKFNNIPIVFAKKSKSLILNDENVYSYEVKSFTRKTTSQIFIDKNYLKETDNCLIVDDFLAEGNACMGLINICEQANSKVEGVAIVIDKAFQGGRERIIKENIQLESAAIISSISNNKVFF